MILQKLMNRNLHIVKIPKSITYHTCQATHEAVKNVHEIFAQKLPSNKKKLSGIFKMKECLLSKAE